MTTEHDDEETIMQVTENGYAVYTHTRAGITYFDYFVNSPAMGNYTDPTDPDIFYTIYYN